VKKQMLEETLEFKPVFLDVDPVYGTLFADYCRKQNICIPSLKYIVSSYEYLSRAHRRYMHEVFSVPVYNLYGSTETGHLLMEDEAGLVKVVNENAFLEFLPLLCDDALKECVVTELTTPTYALRYRIADLPANARTAIPPICRLKDAASFSRSNASRLPGSIRHHGFRINPPLPAHSIEENPRNWRLYY
jgi:phenylacetate-coenzyme A ligase PaaK-like adenylate-forming protein